MKGWMVVLAISRISFAWALLLLVGTAVIGAINDRQLARTLFQTVIVEMIFGAFWFMATSMVAILAVLWFGRRKANPNKNLSA
jgi:hypothetical protein